MSEINTTKLLVFVNVGLKLFFFHCESGLILNILCRIQVDPIFKNAEYFSFEKKKNIHLNINGFIYVYFIQKKIKLL